MSSKTEAPALGAAAEHTDEGFCQALALYTTLASRPTTDRHTRLVCLAKKAALLDAHPRIRAFDNRRSRSKGRNGSATLHPAESSSSSSASASLRPLLIARAAVFRDLAAAYKESGAAVNASAAYDRAVQLMQSLPDDSDCLSEALAEWADVEESLGRATKASRLRERSRGCAEEKE
ncbi:hypothetical protein LPJ72_004624 [Coemansia sp. Benny D160-2]|nr:hypothetical protein LPJ72_004624 [Coemansia sp. Benny D160-2]